MEVAMINFNPHVYRTGPNENFNLTAEELKETDKLRKNIEPWLTASFPK